MPPRRLRLDAELVRRGLARSREHASELIAAGRVTVNKARAAKPATGVTTDADIVVREDPDSPDYASRGGHKLAGAFAALMPLGLEVEGRRCLDAGASTGGFTDVLLRHGARQVVAVDVGYGQLVWTLQNDPRVLVRDRTNIREIDLEVRAILAERLGIAAVDEPITELEERLARRYHDEEIGTDAFVYGSDEPARGDDVRSSATGDSTDSVVAHVRLEGAAPGRIRDILITGDFFVTPPRTIFDLESRLRGVAAPDAGAVVDAFFAGANATLLAISPADFRAAVERAIAAPP